MAHKGKIQLMFVIVAPPEQVGEGDRFFSESRTLDVGCASPPCLQLTARARENRKPVTRPYKI